MTEFVYSRPNVTDIMLPVSAPPEGTPLVHSSKNSALGK